MQWWAKLKSFWSGGGSHGTPEWYIRHGAEIHGPFTTHQIKVLIKTRGLNPDAVVRFATPPSVNSSPAPAAGPARTSQSRAGLPRVAFSATLTLGIQQIAYPGQALDLSSGGMLIMTPAPGITPGLELMVAFRLNADSERLALKAQVMRITQDGKVGLRFLDPDPKTMQAIEQHIYRVLKDQLDDRMQRARQGRRGI